MKPPDGIPPELNDDQCRQLLEESKRRIDKLKELCTEESLHAEWVTLMKDEASRNHFLRVLTAVAYKASNLAKFVPLEDDTSFKGVYEGCKLTIDHINRTAVSYDYMYGKLKFK